MRYTPLVVMLSLTACMQDQNAPPIAVYRPGYIPPTQIQPQQASPRQYTLMQGNRLFNCTDYGNGTMQCF